MTTAAALVVGFVAGWLAAWGLFVALVYAGRHRRANAPPVATERLDDLHKAVYGRARDADERRAH